MQRDHSVDVPWTADVARFVRRIAATDVGTCRNLYRGDGARRRRANLTRYLQARRGADILIVGEAPGYRGGRWSGVPFTAERDLDALEAAGEGPYRRTSIRLNGWSEGSATMVHAALRDLDIEHRTILWNVVPAHPARPGEPNSNRTPSAAEVAAGIVCLSWLETLTSPGLTIAVGRIAATARPDAVRVRHPAHGGAQDFRRGFVDALAVYELGLRGSNTTP